MKKMKLIAITSLALLATTACQSTRTNSMTGEQETNSTTWGALAGCAGGAVIGAVANKGKGALAGCAIGGGAGAAIGYQMDKQEELLRQELVSSGVQIQRDGENIQLILANDITFSTGKADLSHSIMPSLRSIVKVMNEFPDTALIVSGHTDSSGSDEYNMNLSRVRAQAVQTELNRAGLSRSRTKVEAYGELQPRCENTTKSGRACNRRVELLVVPI